MRLTPASAIALAFALGSPPAAAGTSLDSCKGFIDSLPHSIEGGAPSSGTYCLRRDFSQAFDGGALQGTGNNLTIDCNGFSIENTAGNYLGTGITVTGDNVTVRNCGVRGFQQGIYAYGQNSRIEDNRLRDLGGSAIYSQGERSVVTRNHIMDVGLTEVGGATGIVAYAIADVTDNVIEGVRPQPNGSGDASVTGIYLYISQNGKVSGNRIRGMVPMGSGSSEYGIQAFGGTVAITRNHIDGSDNRANSWGIYCSGGAAPRAGGNIVTGYYRWLGSAFGVAAASPGCLGMGEGNLGVP